MAQSPGSPGSPGGWTSVRELVVAYNKGDEERFTEVRNKFEHDRKVTIIDEYYTQKDPPSGVVFTKEVVGRWPRKRERYRFRPYYDASGRDPSVGAMLRSAHAIERKWSFLLSTRNQKILEGLTYTLIVHLLGLLCNKNDLAIKSAQKELDDILAFAQDSARRAALIWYLWGLPIGVLTGAGVAAGVWVSHFEVPYKGTFPIAGQIAFCLGFGAIGAAISVMIRVTRQQRLDVDIQQSRFMTVLAGVFRPIIGAVLGAVIFVLIGGGLLPSFSTADPNAQFFFYTGLAFLAGFSERWAQDTIVHSAPRTPSGSDQTPSS